MKKNNRYTGAFQEADAAFRKSYPDMLKQLKALTDEDLKAISPATNCREVYQSLMEVVEQAAKDNTAQAQLVANIKKLGDIAVSIAKKVASLAALF